MADVNLMPADVRSMTPNVEPKPEKISKGAMELEKLESFLDDIKSEPEWRSEANKAHDYYDGNQLDRETIDAMQEKGLPTVVINLCKPTIDAVLGMEVKTRTDWVVKAETEEQFDMAKALTIKLKEAEKASRADRACADAYGAQVKGGIGWVEVGRERDPFKYPYRCRAIHRKELWWDWRSQQPDLEEARFLVRKRWFDVDHVTTFMPEHAELIGKAYGNFPNWEAGLNQGFKTEDLYADWDASRRTTIEEEEWRDTDRKRIALFEVWYKHWVHGHVLRLPDGRVVEFNKDDQRHVAAVQSGVIELEPATFTKMRLAIWMGPHRLYDMPSPYKHNKFPYVPFFGYREDKTGKPYGMMRAMFDPQDEVNARRAKMLWLLSSNMVEVDEDAVDDHTETAKEVNRPDAYIVLNKNRKNQNALKITRGSELSPQQYQMLIESKANVQEASGMFGEALGRRGSSAQSGEAIKNLVEQSTASLGELNDNYKNSRQDVGEILLSLITEDMTAMEGVEVGIKGNSGEDKVVVLNNTAADDYGNTYRDNDVSRLKATVTLADVSSTATYREHVLNELLRLTQTLPPEIQAVLIESILDATDLPNKNEMVEKVRALTGGGKEELSEEEQAAQAQEQARIKAIEDKLIELDIAQKAADVSKTEAEAELKVTQADKIELEAELEIHDRTSQLGIQTYQQA